MAKSNGGTRASGTSTGGVVAVPVTDSSIRSFLLSYTPAESGFTSNAEIELVTKNLGLDNLNNEQLQEMRNKVVRIYSNAQEKEINYDENGNFAGRTEKYWDYSEGMMSDTAVIDEVRRRKGTPISQL